MFKERLWNLRVFGIDIAPVVVIFVVVAVDRMLMIKPISFAMLPLAKLDNKSNNTQIWFIIV